MTFDREALANLLAEANAYVQLRATLGLRPDPLCPRMIALRDSLNMLPAIDATEERRMQEIVARSDRNRATRRIVTSMERDSAYDDTDRTAWLGDFPK